MPPPVFRILALACAVTIASGYIWWASGRKTGESDAAADEAAADINPNQADPTHFMVSSKRIEMPVFSARRKLLPGQEKLPDEEFVTEIELGEDFEGFINYGSPIQPASILREPIKTTLDPPARKAEDREPIPERDLRVLPSTKSGAIIDVEALKKLGIDFLPSPQEP